MVGVDSEMAEMIEITPIASPFIRKMDLPGSKSIVNRVLLLASLAEGESFFRNFLLSDDTEAMLESLQRLGVRVELNRGRKELRVYGCGGEFPHKKVDLFTRDSGTTTRFLIPILAAQETGEFTISASERMSARPLQPLLKAIEALGGVIHYHDKPYALPLTIYARGLLGGSLEVSVEESTQFLSGLLMASPFFKSSIFLSSHRQKHSEDLALIKTHNQSYVKLTAQLMEKFGAKIKKLDSDNTGGQGILTLPGQYQNQENFYIEPDISTASYFFAAAVLTGGEVEISNISLDSTQGDIQFLEILKLMGAEVLGKPDSILVKGNSLKSLKGLSVNMRDFSDTFMTLAALACFAEGPTEICGIAHTRFQESNRIEAVASGLRLLGARVEIFEDGLKIYPQRLHGGLVSSFNDHRIAMSLALIGLKVPGVQILNPECVKKTCPDYFERLQSDIASE